MIRLNLILHAGLACALLAACGDLDNQTTGSTDTASTTDGSSSATDTATTTAGATSSGSTDSDATTADATTSEATSADGTTGAPACDLVELTCAAAEVMGPVKDCGVVDPWNNTVAEWQTAVDCALAAAQAQQGFKLIVWLQGIDSNVGTGYYGVAAESYMLATINYDSYPPASAVQRACASLSMIAGCALDLGQPCLTCDSPGVDAQLCEGA